MKQFVTILLTAIIFLQTFSSYVIQGSYYLNKSYIAKVLCINREKPMLHCNGKCYLAKRLKEQEQQEQQVPGSKKQSFEVQPCFLPTEFNLANVPFSVRIKYFNTTDRISSALLRSVFHPPTV